MFMVTLESVTEYADYTIRSLTLARGVRCDIDHCIHSLTHMFVYIHTDIPTHTL